MNLEAKRRSAALEGGDAALTLLLFVVLLAFVDERFATSEHEVDHACEFVRHRSVGPWLVHATAQASVERAQC